MYISQNDTRVPSSTQWQLYELLGAPEIRSSNLGHMRLPLWTSVFHKKDLIGFFNKRVLGKEEAASGDESNDLLEQAETVGLP